MAPVPAPIPEISDDEMEAAILPNWERSETKRDRWTLKEGAGFEYFEPVFGHVGKKRVYRQLQYERDQNDVIPIEQCVLVGQGIVRTLREAYALEQKRKEAAERVAP